MSDALLQVQHLTAGYSSVRILQDVSIEVERGKIVTMIGPNGAGKTTLARTLSGFTRMFAGDLILAGEPIAALPPEKRVLKGIGSVPEGRRLFPALTVQQNLELALFARWDELGAPRREALLGQAFDHFPRLLERRGQRAGSLSGGEQQMLAIARALILEPKLLILDEPSTGLAPMVVAQIFASLRAIVTSGQCGCLLIEQQAVTALEVADFAYVLERGRVTAKGDAKTLRADPELRDRYLGTSRKHR